MLRLVAGEDFNNDIVRALKRRKPELDIVRVQDAGLGGADDPSVLECERRQRGKAGCYSLMMSVQ